MNLKSNTLLAQVAIVVAIAAAYALSLGNDWISDDVYIVLERVAPPVATSLPHLWAEDYWGPLTASGLYRPMTLSVLYVERRLFGVDPLPFRIVGLLLYATACLLAFQLLLHLANLPAAVAGALVFALHPAHVEAVITGYGQAEMLAGGFALAAALLYVKAHRDGSRLKVAGAILCYLAAIFSKESAAVLPFLLMLTRGLFLEPDQRGWRRWIGPAEFLFFLAAIPYAIARIAVLHGVGVPSDAAVLTPFSTLARYHMVAVGLGNYLQILIFPFVQSFVYDFFDHPGRDVAWVTAVGFVILFFGARLGFRRTAFGVGWFLILWFVFSSLVLPVGTLVAERLLFLALFGFAFLLAAMFDKAWNASPAWRKGASVALVLLVAAYIGQTVRTTYDWRDPENIWRSSLRSHPNSPTALAGLAIALIDRAETTHLVEPSEIREAGDSVAKALATVAISPDAIRAQARLSAFHGDLPKAIEQAKYAISLRPRDANIWKDLRNYEARLQRRESRQ